MKIRNGFVSNSSSSSFIIKKEDLSEEQIEILLNLYPLKDPNDYVSEYKRSKKYHKKLEEFGGIGDAWGIKEYPNGDIYGSTFMDNGYLHEFMQKINIDVDKIKWEDQQ